MPGMTTLHFRGCGRVIVVVVFGIRLDLRPTHLRGLFLFFIFFSFLFYFFLPQGESGKNECLKDERLCISSRMHDEVSVLNTNVTIR